MKLILPIFSILICAFAAYFGLTQSEKFKQIQEIRVATKLQNKTVATNVKKAEDELEKIQKRADEIKGNLEVLSQSVIALSSNSKQLTGELKTLEETIQKQEAEFAKLDQSLKDILQLFADMNVVGDVDVENLSEKMLEVEEKIKTEKIKADELQELVNAADKKLSNQKVENTALIAREVARNERIASNSLEARVTAIDHQWGFIVINAGLNAGISTDRPLLVTRSGTLIGKIVPSAVEANQTIAEINYRTLSPGVRIQPGDQVIFASAAAN